MLWKQSKGISLAMVGSAVAVGLLIGCARPVMKGSLSAPVAGPDSGTSTILPQIGLPAAGDETSPSGSSIVGAGSFPRSFLILGTDTSIRIGG
jgi:hypothetical protein